MARRLKVPAIRLDGMRAEVRTHEQPGRRSSPADRSAEPWRGAYRTREYQEARQACIERARGRCERCGRVGAVRRQDGTWRTFAGFGCHHTVRLADGGEGAPLAFLCRPCHWEADHPGA